MEAAGAIQPRPGLSSEDSVNGSDRQITVNRVEKRIRNEKDLIRICGIDVAEWKIVRWVCNKWEVGAKVGPRDNPELICKPLYQVKAWLERKRELIDARAEIAELAAEARKTFKLPLLPAPRTAPKGNMLELGIPDLHLGKLAHSDETGYRSYDHRIAKDDFNGAVDGLLSQAEPSNPERIVFVVGNDYLHADSRRNQTFNGTPLDSDSRYFKLFRCGFDMAKDAILKMRAMAPVHVVVVPGNHDLESAWHLGHSLECFFRTEKYVTVDNAPRNRKFVQHGTVGLMFTHGDKGKHDRYPLLMATEDRELWGKTTWNEIHCGHLHQTRVREHNGVRVRILSALCPPDAWHAELGFVGNKQCAEAFIWHREAGLRGILVHSAAS